MVSEGRRRLADHIRSAISNGIYRSGDRLPALRVLAEQFKLTLSTTHNTLLALQQEKLLEIRNRGGVYVCGSPSGAELAVEKKLVVFLADIHHADPMLTYSAHALLGIQEEAARQRCRIDIRFMDYYGNRSPLRIDSSEIPGCDGLIFIGAFDWWGVTYPNEIPAVGLSMYGQPTPQFSTVAIDPFCSARLAVDYFRERHLQRVHFVSHRTWEFGILLHQLLRDELELECHWLEDNDADLELFQDRATGYLFSSGSIAKSVAIRYANTFGESFFKGRTVLSIDGKCRYVPRCEPHDNLGVDWKHAGSLLLRECLYNMHNRGRAGNRVLMIPDLQIVSKP